MGQVPVRRDSILRRARATAGRLDRDALGTAWTAWAWSRLLAVAVGVYVWLRIPPGAQPFRAAITSESIHVAHAFDGWTARGVLSALFQPLTTWDAIHYVQIAQGGYGGHDSLIDPHSAPRAVFFPMYPALTRVAALFSHSTGALIIAAFAVSLVALMGALYLLHRLTALELGRPAARATVLLLAFFPASFVLGAPYTESVFLLFSIGSVYAARRGRWAWAGAAAAAATATRNGGLILLVPLAVLYLWGPREDRPQLDRPFTFLRLRYKPRLDVLWLALAPLTLAAYMVHLQQAVGDPLAWVHGQKAIGRVSAPPWKAFWDSVVAAWHPIAGHPAKPFYDLGSVNVLNLVVFLAAAAALVGVFRRLPAAYGWYTLPGLVLPLTAPWRLSPLISVERYVLLLFPLFMWLGAVCAERRITEKAVAVFAAFFGVLMAAFCYGQFVV